MYQQGKLRPLQISDHTFQITPLSIVLKKFPLGSYQLELDKGCQWIGRFGERISICQRNAFTFNGNQGLEMRTHREKNIKVRMSLYQLNAPQSEIFHGSIDVPINSLYDQYQEELSKNRRGYENVVKAYRQDHQISEQWNSLKQKLTKKTQRFTKSSADGKITISFKVSVLNVLDDREKAESKSKMTQRRSLQESEARLHSHIFSPKNSTSMLLPQKEVQSPQLSIVQESPTKSMMKECTDSATKEQVSESQSMISPVKPRKPVDDLRINLDHKELSDVIQLSNENTTARQQVEPIKEQETASGSSRNQQYKVHRSKTHQLIPDEERTDPEQSHSMKKPVTFNEIPSVQAKLDVIAEDEPSSAKVRVVVPKVKNIEAETVKDGGVQSGRLKNLLAVIALILVFLGAVANVPVLKKKVRLDRLQGEVAGVRRARGRDRTHS